MIADQKIGKSFMGALGYNLKKLNHKDPNQRAELLETNFASLDTDLIKKEIELVRSKRPALGNYVYHTSLNFLQEETVKLDNSKLLVIAGDYLQGMGFNNNQYMIFRHHDADHPHIHLLVNRITFDGDVVSDSNNFKRSEALLRKLERLHNLKMVPQSKYAAVKATDKNIKVFPTRSEFKRAPKKDEIEMAIRTGQASNKMLVQEKLSVILNQPKRSMQDFIRQCEAEGVYLLFNQATTGHISGITFFYNDFKAKGQALGGRFKWMEIIKQLDYEQNRDRQEIGNANSRTKAKYGEQTTTGANTATSEQRGSGSSMASEDLTYRAQQHGGIEKADGNLITIDEGSGSENGGNEKRSVETDQDDNLVADNGIYRDHCYSDDINIQISDDIDDEAILGKDRHRQKKARTNRR